jgi:4-diphosphocytidyl-2-C-methyl-D-erythritol kinase
MKEQKYHKFATYLSPAKLNLGLKITGKKEDGYHLLKTVFCLIDLFDEIDIQITNDKKISLIEHNQAWPFYTDLSYRAAILLQEYSGTSFGANIKIRKTIPSGAGLGGGSSNAATVLMVLNELWGLNISNTKLMELGISLGADVPFFIYGQNALALGIGEILSPVDIPKQYFVLVKPSFHIPTRNIFAHLKISNLNINADSITANWLINTKENDLFPIATNLYPQLQNIVNELQEFGNTSMTGSGSVLYLTFFEKNIAKKVAKILESRYNTYLVKRLHYSPLKLR